MSPQSKESKDANSINCAIEKAAEFVQKIQLILEKKPKQADCLKKLAFLKIAQLFLQKSISDSKCSKSQVNLPASPASEIKSSQEFTSLGASKIEFPEHEFLQDKCLSPSGASTKNNTSFYESNQMENSIFHSCIEAEIDELAGLLFEEANKFVYEERVKQAQLAKELEELKLANCKNLQEQLSISFSEFIQQSKTCLSFKSLSALNINERILIDGMLLGDFQESIAKSKGESSVCELISTEFCKKIHLTLIEPNIMHFKALKSSISRKKILEACQQHAFSFERILSFSPTEPVPVASKCSLCNVERVCEFLICIPILELSNSHIDRFCLHKLQIISDYFCFLGKISSEKTRPLLVLYREMLAHLHLLGISIFQGTILTSSAEDSFFPSIDIVH